jgi:hypothetical protein
LPPRRRVDTGAFNLGRSRPHGQDITRLETQRALELFAMDDIVLRAVSSPSHSPRARQGICSGSRDHVVGPGAGRLRIYCTMPHVDRPHAIPRVKKPRRERFTRPSEDSTAFLPVLDPVANSCHREVKHPVRDPQVRLFVEKPTPVRRSSAYVGPENRSWDSQALAHQPD